MTKPKLPRKKAKCTECKKNFLTAHSKKMCPKCVARIKMREYRAEYSKNPDKTTKDRVCLSCDQKFKSIDDNRICSNCKNTQDWREAEYATDY